MLRRLLPLALLVAAMLGCAGNDKPPPNPNNPGPDDQPDPNATYTIKLRDQQKGDKTHVVKTRTGSMTIATGNTSQTLHDNLKYEYTETVLDMAPGEPRPTKVTRVYAVSERSEPKGGMKSASHVGKTITIEKYLKGYKYSLDGNVSLPVAEQLEVNEDFAGGKGGNFEGMLPKSAVKVGEEWPVDSSVIEAIAGKPPAKSDNDKNQITGKLVRAYKKDGLQWGVIEWKVIPIIDTTEKGSPVRGSMPSTITVETAIDGSVRAGSIRMTTQGKFDRKNEFGHEVKTTIEGTQEQTLTPVK